VKPNISLIAALTLISLTSCKTVGSRSEGKFGAGEHLTLGNNGYAEACRSFKICPESIPRADGKVSFRYGELVAFAGDFYGTSEAMDSDTDNGSYWTFFTQRNIQQTKALFAEEVADIQKQINSGKLEDDRGNELYRDNNVGYTASFGYQYFELAADNVAHFGWHNIKQYVREHDKALDLAVQAHASTDRKEKTALLRKALVTNAFADHFLTDSFASGHLRVPRSQGMEWGQANGRYKAALGAVAKILHDHDHRFETSGGLKVMNSRGEAWKTRGDGELFVIPKGETPVYVTIPTEAVRISVTEVLDTYLTGKAPSGLFAAIELVPYIDPSESKLVDTFPATVSDKQLSELTADIGIVGTSAKAVGFNHALVREFFQVLPDLMKKFRTDVSVDLEKGLVIYEDPKAPNPVVKKKIDLRERLPEKYIRGFLSVQ
jgi:hypothetical protein